MFLYTFNVSVDLDSFRCALAETYGNGRIYLSMERYDRFALLNGLGYPICSDEEIEIFFLENVHREYIHADTVSEEQYDHLYFHNYCMVMSKKCYTYSKIIF